MNKIRTAWTVIRSGAWVGVVNTILTFGVTYGVLDASQRGAVINGCAGAVNAANLLATVIHTRKVKRAVQAPSATLVGPTAI